jgi:hypothetical protein
MVNVGTNGLPKDWQQVQLYSGQMQYQQGICPTCIAAVNGEA